MSLSIRHRLTQEKYSSKLIATISAAVLLATSFVGFAPAPVVHAVDLPTDISFGRTAGTNIYNTDLLSGTATDPDGVSAVSIRFVRAVNGVPQSALIPASTGSDGSWSVQLTKSVLSPINLADSNVNVVVRVVDGIGNVATSTFGPYHYSVPDAEIFQSVTEILATADPITCPVAQVLASHSAVTVFGPNNEALQALPADELQALMDSPDELCAVVSAHVVPSVIASSDVTGPTQVPTLVSSNQPLNVAPEDGTVLVNSTPVTNADNPVRGGGLLHIVDALINPRSNEVDINDIYTGSPSPALHGTVLNPDATVTVRINGKTYAAENNGDGTWDVAAGIVALDPLAANTLFTVVSRVVITNPLDQAVVVDQLLGISMRNDVLHYIAPQVSATTVTGSIRIETASTVLAENVCSNQCDAGGQTSSATVSVDGDKNSKQAPTVEKQDQTAKTTKTSNQWYWWLIGIATLAALYYVLGGGNPPAEK